MNRRKEREDYYKKIGRCTRCGNQDAYTLNGKTLCYDCNCKNKEYSKKHHERYRTKDNEKMRERTKTLRKQGLCIDCGKRRAKNNRVRCEQCLLKNNKMVKAHKNRVNRDMVKYMDICYLCCKNPIVEGHKVCTQCLNKCRERQKNVTETSKREQEDSG